MEKALSLFAQILEMYEDQQSVEAIAAATELTPYQVMIILANYYEGSNPTTQ